MHAVVASAQRTDCTVLSRSLDGASDICEEEISFGVNVDAAGERRSRMLLDDSKDWEVATTMSTRQPRDQWNAYRSRCRHHGTRANDAAAATSRRKPAVGARVRYFEAELVDAVLLALEQRPLRPVRCEATKGLLYCGKCGAPALSPKHCPQLGQAAP